MYVTPKTARNTLWQRREDLSLRRRTREEIGELPEFLANGPRAVLARHLATPNFEFHIFSARARQVGLGASCPVYLQDRFCTRNPDKLALARPTFYLGQGRKGGVKSRGYEIIDRERWEDQPFGEITTLWQENFAGFHHRLLRRHFPGVEIHDASSWLQRMGGKPSLFWPRFLSLFVCDGILFENFHSEGHETEFTRDIIRPAIRAVESRLGVPPLIVPLLPVAEERQSYWSWYPSVLEEEVRQGLELPTPQPSVASDFVPLPLAARGGSHA